MPSTIEATVERNLKNAETSFARFDEKKKRVEEKYVSARAKVLHEALGDFMKRTEPLRLKKGSTSFTVVEPENINWHPLFPSMLDFLYFRGKNEELRITATEPNAVEHVLCVAVWDEKGINRQIYLETVNAKNYDVSMFSARVFRDDKDMEQKGNVVEQAAWSEDIDIIRIVWGENLLKFAQGEARRMLTPRVFLHPVTK